MSQIQFFKVNALPQTFQGNAFYYVANGEFAESYLTNSAGVPKALGNTAMTKALIQEALAEFSAGANAIEIVANIAARDSLIAGSENNLMILVIDATGDSSVGSGSALYAFAHASSTTYKVAEYESMDVVVSWASIVGRPTSAIAQIDNAVTLAHSHANKAVLDKLSEGDGGALLYGGAAIATDWTTTNW